MNGQFLFKGSRCHLMSRAAQPVTCTGRTMHFMLYFLKHIGIFCLSHHGCKTFKFKLHVSCYTYSSYWLHKKTPMVNLSYPILVLKNSTSSWHVHKYYDSDMATEVLLKGTNYLVKTTLLAVMKIMVTFHVCLHAASCCSKKTVVKHFNTCQCPRDQGPCKWNISRWLKK